MENMIKLDRHFTTVERKVDSSPSNLGPTSQIKDIFYSLFTARCPDVCLQWRIDMSSAMVIKSPRVECVSWAEFEVARAVGAQSPGGGYLYVRDTFHRMGTEADSV